MEWNFKASSWDFTEYEHGSIPNCESIDGSNDKDFSIDLKLGQVDDVVGSCKEVEISKMGSFSDAATGGSSKRARVVSCLVDGCDYDLTSCKDYNRRHKVCEAHSKTPQVTINGNNQRFCQQCSRFHSLEEFDEGKRSCRKRLDGHNRRRRKPHADPLSRSRHVLLNKQGAGLSFTSSQAYPSTIITSPDWGDTQSYNQFQLQPPSKHNLFPIFSPSSSYDVEKQQTSFQEDNNSSSYTVPPIRTFSVCEDSYVNTYHDRLATTRTCESDCALSLLSSQVPETGFSEMVLSKKGYMDSSVHVSNTTGYGDVHRSGEFQIGRDESSYASEEASQTTLPFPWG